MRIRRSAARVFLAAAALSGGPACAGGADPADDPEPPDPQIAALDRVRRDWDSRAKLWRELEDRLPPLLAPFGESAPEAWEAAARRLRGLPAELQVDPLPRLLPDAASRGARGDRARRELALLGELYAAVAGFRKPDPAAWAEARARLVALGAPGVDGAAVRLVLRLHPLDVPADEVSLVQEHLAALPDRALLVLAAALERANPMVRERLLPVFARKGAGAVPALLELLAHPEAGVRATAIRALRAIPDPRAVAALLPLAAPGQPWGLRSEALLALGNSGDPRARAPLLAAVADPDVSVARFAAEGTGTLLAGSGDVEAARVLIALAARPGDDASEAREAALRALRRLTGVKGGGRATFEDWLRSREGRS
ncbi:MAG: HEAT repeat domain-containing protein [Planctomycetales bacterium]|nr:HEAT repeat domain-containing protein [Planctomycetales bacterium]